MICENIIPKSLKEIKSHSEIIGKLIKFSENITPTQGFPNMLIYGPKNSGKYTMVKCLLNDIYGNGIYNTTSISHTAKQNCSNYKINLIKSKFHFETNFTGLQYADKHMLISLLDNFFSTTDIYTHSYKILIIRHFDELTKPAQMAIKRKMEKNMESVRFIFLVNDLNKIDYAIQSRCFTIRYRSPRNNEILNIVDEYTKKKKIPLSDEKKNTILSVSNRNIKIAFYYLELLLEKDKIVLSDPIDKCISNLTDLFEDEKIKVETVREKITQLQLSKIPLNKILKKIITKYNKNYELVIKITEKVALYDHKYNLCKKYSIILECLFFEIYYLINEK